MKRIPILESTSELKKEFIQLLGENSMDMECIKSLLFKEGFKNLIHNSSSIEPHVGLAILVCNDCRETLNIIRQENEEIPVIVISQPHDTSDIVDIMRNGAYDFFTKPIDERRFILAVLRGLERRILMQALNNAASIQSRQLSNPESFSHIITQDSEMFQVFKYLENVVNTPHPILVTGETGVGKELIARAIYLASGKKNFVTLNIAGVDDTVFSDTLFGHTKGAFTGAETSREGLIVKSTDGILFLDEIGNLSEVSQIKLLRLIQEGEYYPLGADNPSKFNAKLILATNVNLEKAVQQNTFRKDLFYRIMTHHVHIPTLLQRIGDLPLLVSYFVAKASKALDKRPPTIPPEVINLLNCYDFPGNIRELESMVNDAVARHKRGVLSMSTFEEKIKISRESRADAQNKEKEGKINEDKVNFHCKLSHFPTLKEMEDYLIRIALKKAQNNQGIAAGLLGISRQALNKRLNKSNK